MSYEVTIIHKRETLKPNPKYRGERHSFGGFPNSEEWPDPQILVSEERVLLQQNFDELDLTAVIKTLNKIK